MVASGFEGFEKRLELRFDSLPQESQPEGPTGLRGLCFDSLQEVLKAVQCSIVSAAANRSFDAYVLSESSLFVYPTKVIIKTCGTTQLLKSVRPLVKIATDLGLELCGCRYTRGSFIFPKAQPYPHTTFREEIVWLDESLSSRLCYRKASVLPSKFPSHCWHVFSAGDDSSLLRDECFTVEVCMTELDPSIAGKFFTRVNSSGNDMTSASRIHEINPSAVICDFAFDPCGYSMNGIDGDRYSTIHVTPEDGFSYASFERVFSPSDDADGGIGQVLTIVAQIFLPGKMTVATTGADLDVSKRVSHALEQAGWARRSWVVEEFPAAGSVSFQMFTAAPRTWTLGSC